MIFTLILFILLLLIYVIELISKENFVLCNSKPSGPYKTKCTNIEFNNNILSALCLSDISDNIYVNTHLDLNDCVKNNNDCESININNIGNLMTDYELFKKLNEIVGCPDCADGGAEWIEIIKGDSKHKVTFECGKAPKEIDSLVTVLREKKTYFEGKYLK